MHTLNHTHDPAARSWVASANTPDTDFPLQNLPFGVFSAKQVARVGVAMGDQVLDIAAVRATGLIATTQIPTRAEAEKATQSCEAASLNGLMALGPQA